MASNVISGVKDDGGTVTLRDIQVPLDSDVEKG
jgi:hypothetical protein